MGFCQAQDRAFHVDAYVRAARGRLAELAGPEMLDADRLARRIGFARIAEAQLAACAPHVRAQMEAFAHGVRDGVRLGLSKKPHEHALAGGEPLPFVASDVLAVLQFFAFALSSNWDAELARLRVLREDGQGALLALETADPTLLDPGVLGREVSVLRAAESFAHAAGEAVRAVGAGGASNNWAIAPSRTKTGRALLASDPHLMPSLPAPWYLLHVRTPRWAMTGACLPSQPIVSFGHNAHVAWGLTAGHADNTDLFVERLGADGASVREGDRFVPCDVREEIIRVKGRADVRERVLVTRRGPIVTPLLGRDEAALSMRGTWMAARAVGGYDVWRAKDVEEARRSWASYPAVSESRVLADVGGRIAWQLAGDVPVRKKGHGLLPMPGWDPGVGWEREPLAFERMPHVVDPPSGFVASANQPPAHRDGGTPFLGADWLDRHRYDRVVDRLEARSNWDVASCAALQCDRTTLVWRAIRTPVLVALRERARGEGDARVALGLLEEWNGVVAPESAAASVFELLFAEMTVRAVRAKAPRAWRAAIGEGPNAVIPHGAMNLRRIEHTTRLLRDQPAGWFDRGWPVELASALDEVVRTLRRAAGPDPARWAWGRARPLALVHPLGTKPVLRSLFNLGPIAFGGDATTIPQASVDFAAPLGNAIGIPNLRVVIDVGAWENSRWILAGGQSGNPASPHYDDMLPMWERGDGISIAWAPDAVRRSAVASLRLRARSSARLSVGSTTR
jgi:penicillin amidase